MATEIETGDDSFLPIPCLALAPAAIAVAGACRVAVSATNGDVAWYLYVAGRVLDGARPYVDLVDTNPPLIIAINLAIVGLSRAVGLSPLAVFPAVVFATTGVSLGLAWRLGRGLPGALRQASLLAWAFLLMVQVGVSFGQREHLMTILILPYAFGAIAEAGGDRPPRGLSILAGLMAGIGFGLKPFFVPAALAVEIFLAARIGPRVWLRPRALAMGAVFVVYAATIAVWTPEYFDVARRFAPLYPHHDPFGPRLWESSWRLAVVASAVGLGWVTTRRWADTWASVSGLLAVWLTVAVYLTGKGWLYHWFPPMAASLAMLAGSLASMISRWPRDSRRAWSTALLATLLPCFTILSFAESLSFRNRDAEAERLVREVGRRGEAVLVLSCWIHHSFPMINESGATWGMRHPMLWQVPAFYAGAPWKPGGYHPISEMAAPERTFVGELADDFSRYQPALVLVEDDPPLPSMAGFDYLTYLSAEPRFAGLMEDYAPVGRSRFFRIFRRRDSPAAPDHSASRR